jgi:hypothetical protein
MNRSSRAWRAIVAVAITVGASSGCAAASSTGEPASAPGSPTVSAPSDETSSAPTLLTYPASAGLLEARVTGVLGVNDQNCFALDGVLLIAPSGSTVSADGTSIDVAGLGTTSRGETIDTSGGWTEPERGTQPPRAYLRCLGNERTFITINAGG